MFVRDSLFIGGKWVRPAQDAHLDVLSPTSEEPVGRVPAASVADVDRAVASARNAFDTGPWPAMSVAERGELLKSMAADLIGRVDELVELQIDEMGSPRKWISVGTKAMVGSTQAKVSAALDLPLREVRDGNVGKVLVCREPTGVVGAIIPWNAPVPMLLAKLVPAL